MEYWGRGSAGPRPRLLVGLIVACAILRRAVAGASGWGGWRNEWSLSRTAGSDRRFKPWRAICRQPGGSLRAGTLGHPVWVPTVCAMAPGHGPATRIVPVRTSSRLSEGSRTRTVAGRGRRCSPAISASQTGCRRRCPRASGQARQTRSICDGDGRCRQAHVPRRPPGVRDLCCRSPTSPRQPLRA